MEAEQELITAQQFWDSLAPLRVSKVGGSSYRAFEYLWLRCGCKMGELRVRISDFTHNCGATDHAVRKWLDNLEGVGVIEVVERDRSKQEEGPNREVIKWGPIVTDRLTGAFTVWVFQPFPGSRSHVPCDRQARLAFMSEQANTEKSQDGRSDLPDAKGRSQDERSDLPATKGRSQTEAATPHPLSPTPRTADMVLARARASVQSVVVDEIQSQQQQTEGAVSLATLRQTAESAIAKLWPAGLCDTDDGRAAQRLLYAAALLSLTEFSPAWLHRGGDALRNARTSRDPPANESTYLAGCLRNACYQVEGMAEPDVTRSWFGTLIAVFERATKAYLPTLPKRVSQDDQRRETYAALAKQAQDTPWPTNGGAALVKEVRRMAAETKREPT